jgi:hypothetical protein
MGVKPFDMNSLGQGIETGNALLDAPIKRDLMQAQAQYYGSPDARSSVYGTPIYGVDPVTGDQVLGAIGKDGTFQRLDTGGVQVTPGVTFQNLGTSVQPFSSKTGAPMAAPTPIDVSGEASQKEVGKQRGEAFVDMPGALSKADQAISLIDKMIEHPGREAATGKSGMFDPRNYIPGTDAKNFQIAAKQLEGKTFLEAFESLKGGGHITEIEGQKGTEAVARLDRAQSDEAYVEALQELRGIIEIGKQRATQRAGVRSVPTMNVTPSGSMTPTQPPPVTTDSPYNPDVQMPQGMNEETVKRWVQEAMDAGVPENAIRSELLKMGVKVGQ